MPRGEGLHLSENRGAGGGETRDNFKETVGKRGEFSREPEGKGAEQAEKNPDEPHHGEALPGEAIRPGPKANQQAAQQANQSNGIQKRLGVLPVNQADHQRKQQAQSFQLQSTS